MRRNSQPQQDTAADADKGFGLFVTRVHELLQAGYATMKPVAYNTCEEPEISGELADRIETFLEGRSKPWMRYWTAMDNAPENQPHLPLAKRRMGKRRKLPDLKFKYSGQRETLYFRFEAKKLKDTGSFRDLISSEDGLGRFISREYGRKDVAGGLLGYVQLETPEIHASRVANAFAENPKLYRIEPDGGWTMVKWPNGPACCFRTIHTRKYTSQTITIFHSFLSFR